VFEPGEYVITVPITFRGKAVTVRSEAGRDETTIRMGTPADTNRGSVVIFENNETAASVLDGFTITFTNYIIRGNTTTKESGGRVLCRNASATVTNSIVWGKTSPVGREISVRDPASTLTIAYSNVGGGQAGASVEGSCVLDWGEGNIDTDPFLDDTNNGDFHLKSEAGRWDPNSQIWIQDNVSSPCIDAGDPNSPVAFEPFPNGGFVNMGAYGSTPEASKAYFGEPICGTIVAGDINGDCKVDFTEF